MGMYDFSGLRWSSVSGDDHFLWTATKREDGDVDNGPIYQMTVGRRPGAPGWVLARCVFTGWQYHWHRTAGYRSAEAAMRAGANDPRLHGLTAGA